MTEATDEPTPVEHLRAFLDVWPAVRTIHSGTYAEPGHILRREDLEAVLAELEQLRDAELAAEEARGAAGRLAEVLQDIFNGFCRATDLDGRTLGWIFPAAVHPDDYDRWRTVLETAAPRATDTSSPLAGPVEAHGETTRLAAVLREVLGQFVPTVTGDQVTVYWRSAPVHHTHFDRWYAVADAIRDTTTDTGATPVNEQPLTAAISQRPVADYLALINRAQPLLAAINGHDYLSTSCLHGHHRHCQISTTRYDGTRKAPARCKWCPAPCRCACHQQPVAGPSTPASCPPACTEQHRYDGGCLLDPEQFPDDTAAISHARDPERSGPWVWRCWGTDTCDGWLSFDHASAAEARRSYDRHARVAHTPPLPRRTRLKHGLVQGLIDGAKAQTPGGAAS